MTAVDNFPYLAAATLAIQLMSENPRLGEAAAIGIAWYFYKADDGKTFQAETYSVNVEATIPQIQSGSLPRCEPPPRVLEKALAVARRIL